MKAWLGAGIAVLLLACGAALCLIAPIPARADTTSDLAQCEKTVKFKTGDIEGDDVASCMQAAGYMLDGSLPMDSLTQCHNMLYPAIEMRCYRKPGVIDTGKVPAPLPPNWREARIEALLAQEKDWNGKCRDGMASRFLTADVCNRRDRLVMVLKARGLCFEAENPGDLTEASKTWRACAKDIN